jgi:hypothetical protein
MEKHISEKEHSSPKIKAVKFEEDTITFEASENQDNTLSA